MEIWQILTIVLGSLFFVTFLIFIIIYARNKSREAAQSEHLARMYSDPNLAKMEYDFAVYDEETEQLVTNALGKSGQASAATEAEQQLSFLGIADNEGIEEITGNYKP